MAHAFDAIELLLRYETPRLKDMAPEDDVLEWVAAFVGSDGFLDVMDAFCDQHGEQFVSLLTPGGPTAEQVDAMESKWKQVHAAFIDETNSAIERFLTTHGFTMEQYQQRSTAELALSETRHRHTRQSFFVQLLTACCEYDQFLNLMRRAADPEYYDKQALQYEAERIVLQASQHSNAQNAENNATITKTSTEQLEAAQEFLDFARQNPCATLDEMTQAFGAKLQLS